MRRLATAMMLAAAIAGSAAAQTYPTRAVRVVVPAAPGGGTDILARLLAPQVSELLGQTMIVDNRPGGSTNIGTEHVARAAADGYTVLMASTPHAINATLFSKLAFDPVKDFAPITLLATVQTVLVAHPALPVKDVKSLIALARQRPGEIAAGSSAGTSQFLAVELLKARAGIQILNVPYKGAGAAMNDLVAGHVQLQVNTLLAAQPFVQAGRLRPLAVCGPRRAAALPDVPTVGETLPGFESAGWYALLGPAGTPRVAISKLNETFGRALQSPTTRDRLTAQGVDVVAGTPEELAAFLAREIPKWGAVVRAAGLRADG
jgi:tripartite-type tricarboxylate transporter receptor subunit TctC